MKSFMAKALPCLLTAAVFATAMAFRAGAATPQLTREEQEALASVNTLSKAFTGVAKIIRPAVVNIKVERRVAVGRGSFNDPMEFFSGMFGQGFPGFPRSQSHQTHIGQGSGVIVDPNGYILTNNHVVGDADAIRVILLDGRELPAELIGADPASDVAVIKINSPDLTVAKIGDSDVVEVGEWVLAVGNPFGLDFTVTSGIISARGRSGMNVLEMEDFIQTDAAINPGNSGGPLVNLRGEVIGINSFIYTPQTESVGPFGRSNSGGGGSVGVGFAIPSNMAKSIMQSLILHKQITSSYLGVETQALTADLAPAFGLQAPKGALIQAVNKDSPAETAGLRRGDVVIRWGKREIADDQQFRNLVTISTPGEPVEVEVVREGKPLLLKVVLAASTPEVVIEGRSDRFLQNLGIEVTDLTPELRAEIGYDESAFGVLVTSVARTSPARQMGFQPGSLIMTVNGTEVHSQQELKTALGASERVKEYTIVWRNGDFLRRVSLRVN